MPAETSSSSYVFAYRYIVLPSSVFIIFPEVYLSLYLPFAWLITITLGFSAFL